MEVNEAYKIVYEDMKKNAPSLFFGKCDAIHGNEKYMHGIYIVMEFITYHLENFDDKEYQETFLDNLIISKNKKIKIKIFKKILYKLKKIYYNKYIK